jgi:hypothetical protein
MYSYLKQTKMSFCFLQNQRTGRHNRSCLRDWCQWKGERCGEIVLEGEYGGNIVYSCIKMENETC